MSSHDAAQERTSRVPFRSILCPTDLSDTGDCAVEVAYRLTGPGGRVHLMHICEPPFLGNPLYGPYVQGYVPSADETKAGEAKALARLQRLVPASAEEAEVHSEYHVVHGVNVANVIEAEAKRLGCDMVVMGTHGRTGLGRILMGSVATDVVKKSGLPVILVHADHPGNAEDVSATSTAEKIEQGIDRLASGLEGTGI